MNNVCFIYCVFFSVLDKTGIVEFVKVFVECGVEFFFTGGIVCLLVE